MTSCEFKESSLLGMSFDYVGHKDKIVGPYKEAEKFSYVPKNGYRHLKVWH